MPLCYIHIVLRHRIHWEGYLAGFALVAAVTAFGFLTHGIMAPPNMIMLFLLIVVVAALRYGQGPALFTAAAGVLSFDFFLIAPRLTLAVADAQYILTFLGLLITGLVISTLAARARAEAEGARQREAETAALYSLAQDLTAMTRSDEIAAVVVRHVEEVFRGKAAVFVRENELLRMCAATRESESVVGQGPADWVFKHGRATGRGTGAHPAEAAYYAPMRSAPSVAGVLAVCPDGPVAPLSEAQQRLVEAFANQAAVALERAHLVEETSRIQLVQATERLQAALLNSISHDLRTPLATITGAVSSLRDPEVRLDEETTAALIDDIHSEAERLNRLVGNLLDMTRLEAGALRVSKEPCDIAEIVGSALEHQARQMPGRQIELDIPPDLPPVPMSEVLITQVLANLLDNAAKYSPVDAPVRVSARVKDGHLVVEVADRGVGIALADRARVFDKFYRIERPGSVRGTGLGLAISKGIVEAHGGTIEALKRPGGGTIFRFTLPVTTGGAE